jgi:hypothetical protein
MNYELFELHEVGSAGATILDKCNPDLDEIGEPLGPCDAALDE